jgi:hypothetical protein
MAKKRNEFKALVALEAVKGVKTLGELSAAHGERPNSGVRILRVGSCRLATHFSLSGFSFFPGECR